MALAVIGPARGDKKALAKAASYWVQRADVERIVYLGLDGILESLVSSWARQLVGDDAADCAVWERAARRCAEATPDEIEAFVEAEARRERLRMLEALPCAGARAVELLAGKWVLLSDRLDTLDEDDVAPASYIVVGEAKESRISQRGARWLVALGPIQDCWGALLHEQGKDVIVDLVSPQGEVTRSERLRVGQGVKLRISGET